MNRRRGAVCGLVALVTLAAWAPRGEAHKQGTSPYGFNDEVFPILRDRCGACHVRDGVAPMSLMTYDDAVPWGESLRLELMAGHMPPWVAESSVGRLRDSQGLTARELNVLLTWASGDTPVGDPARTPDTIEPPRGWRLGPPDAEVPLPGVTLDADTQERTETLTVAMPFPDGAWLRAIDLRPGTPAIVRSATVASTTGQLLARWQHGDVTIPLSDGHAFRIEAGEGLVVTIRYRKTWAQERMSLTDRSSVGLYLAEGQSTEVTTLELAPGTIAIDSAARLLAVSAGPRHGGGAVRVSITAPGSSPVTLIAFQARPEWTRRFWFERPVTLAPGTLLEVAAPPDADPASHRLLLDVVAAPGTHP